MQLFFRADANQRAAGIAYAAENYGEWVARLRFAEHQLKEIPGKGGSLDVKVCSSYKIWWRTKGKLIILQTVIMQSSKELDKAEKENQGIYLKVVPAFETFVTFA